MIYIALRQGIGFDIELNDEVCYMAETNENKDVMLAFEGAIILLPFIKVHIGTFTEVFEMVAK